MDSAADESCWPSGCGGVYPVKPASRNLRLKTASGADMTHEGEKEVTFRNGGDEVLGMVFQVTSVKKALAAAWRIAEKNNIFQMGPLPEHIFVKNLTTGKKIKLHRVAGTYVMRVEFVSGLMTLQKMKGRRGPNRFFKGQSEGRHCGCKS